ncbi:MAG: 30S ribosomal protein S21 [Candidatus Helarchaeota archaeon]
MIEVIVKDNSLEAFEDAMRVFKKKVNKNGNIQLLKEKKFFKKPSEIKREKKRKHQLLLRRKK